MKITFLAFIFFVSLNSFSSTNRELLNKLVQNESHGKIVDIFTTPTTLNSLSAEYLIPEVMLLPRDVLYFYVPEKFSNMTI